VDHADPRLETGTEPFGGGIRGAVPQMTKKATYTKGLTDSTLVAILRKKIAAERFITLIWKLLKAGYLDIGGQRKNSLAGTPQGGIASPILANVYLHELDMFVEELQMRWEKGKAKRPNPG
jgi:retron-type reverse transcriptase